jgi:serine/threonine protein kinase/Tfp pilus assembly protein PilF
MAVGAGVALQGIVRMTSERWQHVKSLFERALDQPTAARDVLLDAADEKSPSMASEVRVLLARDALTGSFLKTGSVDASEESDFAAGDVVNEHYRIVGLLGSGGMGEVWLAEQTEPVRRQVALKLVKAGMNSRDVMVRFESERQALALMDHPAIAKVFDAGATPTGIPYFAMEYVAGVPITTYCDNHRLSTRERLDLFMRVCEGVQHAHQKAIIHRDLKPSNILITEVNDKAAPKIIDFGVAKALNQRLTADTMFTRVGALVGTPEYMSPEQANSSSEDIDTRTDVYSLGVIFYELLVGAPPLDLRKVAFDELLRKLREDEPAKPSAKIRAQDHAASTELARQRHTEPLALFRQIRGDLDSIALKALEKDRSRRYDSPSDFAADIGRYLRNEAVLAVPPSAAYRARKFARRYRGALVTGCAFALVLIAAAAISIRQSIRANGEAAEARAVTDFFQNDVLAQASAAKQSGPTAKPDPHLEVRTALDRAAARIAGKFNRQPEVEAAIRATIGQTYMELGIYPEARAQLERALDLHRRTLGAENPKTLKDLARLGQIARLQGRYPEAETLFERALKIQSKVLGSEHPDTLDSLHNLGTVLYLQGKYAQAEARLGQVLEIRRRVLGPEHADTVRTMGNLALVYGEQGKYAQTEALDSRILEIERRTLGSEHPDTLRGLTNLATVYVSERKSAPAEALYSEALEIQRRVLGSAHPDTLITMIGLAGVYTDLSKYAQAEALYNEALEIQRRVFGYEHPTTLVCMNNLAEFYTEMGRYAQAEALYSETLEIRRRVLGPLHPYTLGVANSLARAYAAHGNYAQAETLFSQTLETRRRVLGSEDSGTLNTLSDFASMYQRQGKYDLAERYAAQALAGRRHAFGANHPDTMTSAADLALAYLSQGRFTQSEALAREVLEIDRKMQPDDWSRFRAESLLGASLAGQKKYSEAEPLLLEGYQGMLTRKERIAVPDWYHLDHTRQWLVQLYQARGKPAKAAEWKNSHI